MPQPEGGQLTELVNGLPEELYSQALRHASWTEDRADSYEPLATLGDSVLGLAVAAAVYHRYLGQDSGQLTKILNQAVSGVSCAVVGEMIEVPARLRAAAPIDLATGHPVETLLAGERPLPEITEALVGACFLHYGYEQTAVAVAEAFESRIRLSAETRIDFKSALQEALARRGSRVSYEVLSEIGPPHERTFEVAANVEGKHAGTGSGRSKKAAEQAAAKEAFEQLSS